MFMQSLTLNIRELLARVSFKVMKLNNTCSVPISEGKVKDLLNKYAQHYLIMEKQLAITLSAQSATLPKKQSSKVGMKSELEVLEEERGIDLADDAPEISKEEKIDMGRFHLKKKLAAGLKTKMGYATYTAALVKISRYVIEEIGKLQKLDEGLKMAKKGKKKGGLLNQGLVGKFGGLKANTVAFDHAVKTTEAEGQEDNEAHQMYNRQETMSETMQNHLSPHRLAWFIEEDKKQRLKLNDHEQQDIDQLHEELNTDFTKQRNENRISPSKLKVINKKSYDFFRNKSRQKVSLEEKYDQFGGRKGKIFEEQNKKKVLQY